MSVTDEFSIILLYIAEVNGRMKEGKLPNPPSIYEDIGYDSVGLPLDSNLLLTLDPVSPSA